MVVKNSVKGVVTDRGASRLSHASLTSYFTPFFTPFFTPLFTPYFTTVFTPSR